MADQGDAMLPSVSVRTMKQIDARCAALGISPLQLMEHAGHRIAAFAGERKTKRVLVLAGRGNNGGDGLVAARFLHCWGYDVRVAASKNMHVLAAQHWNTLRKLGVQKAGSIGKSDLIIDALLGHATEPPHGTYGQLIKKANASGIPILAVDAPSGLDADTGEAHEPCIRALWTLTLGLPKRGLVKKEAKPYVGELWVADIGIPPEAYRRAGTHVPPFRRELRAAHRFLCVHGNTVVCQGRNSCSSTAGTAKSG